MLTYTLYCIKKPNTGPPNTIPPLNTEPPFFPRFYSNTAKRPNTGRGGGPPNTVPPNTVSFCFPQRGRLLGVS